MMKLADETIQVLKNFSQINSNLVINPGKELKTIADAKNVFASATIADEFPQAFGVYDLNEFLAILAIIEEPELEFKEKFVKISDASGASFVKYFYTDMSMLTAPTREVKLPPNFEVTIDLDANTLSRITTAASTLGHSDIAISPKDGKLNVVVFDQDNATSNNYSILVPGTFQKDVDFEFVMNVNNFRKLVPSDYMVEISSKLISVFTTKNNSLNIQYLIALEKSSSYNN